MRTTRHVELILVCIAMLVPGSVASEMPSENVTRVLRWLVEKDLEEFSSPKADFDHFLDASTPRLAPCARRSHRKPVDATTKLSNAALNVMLDDGWHYYRVRTALGPARLAQVLLNASSSLSEDEDDDEKVTLPASEGLLEWTIPLRSIFAPEDTKEGWEADIEAQMQRLAKVRKDAIALGLSIEMLPSDEDFSRNLPVSSLFCDGLDRVTLFEPWNDPEISQRSNYLGGGFFSWLNSALQGIKFGSSFIPPEILSSIETERKALNEVLPNGFQEKLKGAVLDVDYEHTFDYLSGISSPQMLRHYDFIFNFPPPGATEKYALLVRVPAFSVRRALHYELLSLSTRLQAIQVDFSYKSDGEQAIYDIWRAANDARESVARRLDFALAHEAAHHYLGEMGNIEENEQKVDCYALWNLALAGRPLDLGEAGIVLDVNVASMPPTWAIPLSSEQRENLSARTERLRDIRSRQWESPEELRGFCESRPLKF